MDYRKKYKEALERARNLYKDAIDMDENIRAKQCEIIFPELKESEGEKMRNWILDELRLSYKWAAGDIDRCEELLKAIAWLEKQNHDGKKWIYEDVYLKEKEQLIQDGIDEVLENPQKYGLEKQGKQKTADKVEPKFKVGDWVVWDNKISCHIDNVYRGKESLMYTITDANNMTRSYSVKDFDNNAHFWTIKDAKDGDVLKEDSCVFIINKMKSERTSIVYCCLFDDGVFDLMGSTLSYDVDSTYPATKEQRDLLFQKIREAGYEWNAEKKELRKMEQKPKWTEEDECYMGECISAVATKDGWSFEEKRKTKHWLKSLKQRM